MYVRASVYLIVAQGRFALNHCTAGVGTGAGPDGWSNQLSAESFDGRGRRSVGRAAKSDRDRPVGLGLRPTAFIPQMENECTLFPRV